MNLWGITVLELISHPDRIKGTRPTILVRPKTDPFRSLSGSPNCVMRCACLRPRFAPSRASDIAVVGTTYNVFSYDAL